MVKYPVRVPFKEYRGSKEKLRQKMYRDVETARKIEDYLNKKIEENEKEIQVYDYFQIGSDLGLDTETVRRFLFSVDGGHNGITVFK